MSNNKQITEEVVYEKDYYQEMHGEVRLINGVYRCFLTPLFGGDFIEEGRFETKEEAIIFMDSIC
jgi:hypothetical protein